SEEEALVAELNDDLVAIRRLGAGGLGGDPAEGDRGPDGAPKAEGGDIDLMLASIRDEVQTSLEGEAGWLGRLRALSTPARLGLVVGVVVALTALIVVTTPRQDLSEYPVLRMAMILVVLGALAATASWRLLRPLHLPRPSAASDRVLLVLGVLAPVVAALWPMHEHVHVHEASVGFLESAFRCSAFGGLFGLPVLGLAVVLRRARVDGAAVAALAGVTAGLTANLVLQLHCPMTDPAHILVGHVSLVLLLAPVAAFWRR
ncbi:MAG: NrsF family protein, partial [Myxococcota bacterium]